MAHSPGVQDAGFPGDATEAERLRFLVKYAILAPSGHNTQPWLFKPGDRFLDLFADRTRTLPVVDPGARELTISCGAALEHLAIAARFFGSELSIDELPDPSSPDHLARVRLGRGITPGTDDIRMFQAIPNRRTTRAWYENRVLPDHLCNRCRALADQSDVELVLISDEKQRSEIAGLVAEGDRIQFADPGFRRELAAWVRSRRAATQDGISGEAFGMPDLLSPLGAMIIRTFDMGRRVAAGDRDKIVNGSPLLAVMGTRDDHTANRIATGRSLTRVLLALTASGATASFLNPPIEVEPLRPRLRDVVGTRRVPQLLMRFGYGPASGPAARRPVDEVLI